MRFNGREILDISSGKVELEGRLNHRKTGSGNYNQSGYNNKNNVTFHRSCTEAKLQGCGMSLGINEVGKIESKEPMGLLVLENYNVQYESNTGLPFSFSLIFRDEPDRKHYFAGRSESHIQQWITALKKASYEHWRSQLIILQTKLSALTGKDPLLLFPRNEGVVRDILPSHSPILEKKIGPRTSSFQSHIHITSLKAVDSFSSSSEIVGEACTQNQIKIVQEANLIEF